MLHKIQVEILCIITLDMVYIVCYNISTMKEALLFRGAPEIQKRGDNMPLQYKIDVMQALKEKGYNTNRARKEKLLSESVLQKLRHSEPVSWSNIEQLCKLLSCQPADILEYIPDAAEKEE